ncbi:unnamed protein product [Durusdinium trenchii]|uniref:Uncharacterized protein n=1 Tax=Durusdinium trenchii TaxID=1381693 RepID=A0ABP0N0F1_9DINO
MALTTAVVAHATRAAHGAASTARSRAGFSNDESEDEFLAYRVHTQNLELSYLRDPVGPVSFTQIKHGGRTKPFDTTLCATTCGGLVVIFTGLAFLIAAIANSRIENVEDYSHDVREWQEYDRPLLQETTINMSAQRLNQMGWLDCWNQRFTGELMSSSEEGWEFHDTEDMEGLEQYQPLKKVIELEIPCLYPNCSMDWVSQILPPWPDAPRASFHFQARGGGKHSTFATPEIPLLFDLPTAFQTPQPRLHCWGPGRGVFRRPGTCHHAQRLVELCLAVQLESDGSGWKLRHASQQRSYNSTRRIGTFGCNPQRGYEPTTYQRDSAGIVQIRKKTSTTTDNEVRGRAGSKHW